MNNFSKIGDALKYIDLHLDESINLETLSDRFFFSPYYFHRLFSSIVGKTLAAYIRDRRILYASEQLCGTDKNILDIALSCGFNSAQSFSRAFSAAQGLPPSEYRKNGYQPVRVSADELITKFANRLQGGIFLNPNLLKKERLIIAGTRGDGRSTGEVWSAFEKLSDEKPLLNTLSQNGYEVRLYDGDSCTVHVGCAVSSKEVDPAYSVLELPASRYASFEVYVSGGYESENSAMDEWLQANGDTYSQRLLNGLHYCVEYYDERFNGEAEGSIVEIWIPIEKK